MTTPSVITSCRSCYSTQLVNILSLGNLYLSDFVLNNKKPAAYPLELILCSDCLLLQLRHTTPQSLLYTKNYGYKSGINKTMHNELKEIAIKALKTYDGKKKKLFAVDIGAN